VLRDETDMVPLRRAAVACAAMCEAFICIAFAAATMSAEGPELIGLYNARVTPGILAQACLGPACFAGAQDVSARQLTQSLKRFMRAAEAKRAAAAADAAVKRATKAAIAAAQQVDQRE